MDDSLGLDSLGVPAEPTIVDTWLEPLGDPPCGDDLEWDNDFLEMTQASVGKPGTQFSNDTDAKPPEWRTVQRLAESLFERTRDLRVAIYWARAQVHLSGAVTLPDSLRLVHGLLERYWDDLHPKPDDGDAYARVNALNDMGGAVGLVVDLRQSVIVSGRSIGEVRGREIELALGTLEARDGDSPLMVAQLEQMMADAAAEDPALRSFAARSLARLEQINELMRERVGYASAPDLQPLTALLTSFQGLMPAVDEAAAGGDGTDAGLADVDTSPAEAAPRRGGGAGGGGARGAGLGSSIDTREDALRAIDLVCAYLERTEPTNPAQFFLRRARKLVDKNFIELVRELAPDSLEQVARIMGVSTEDLSSGGSY
jgi:type VI secretion system protein ImpA